MSAFAEFLKHLFEQGTITYREPPARPSQEDRAALEWLERGFGTHRLHVAGPELAFAPEIALAAAELVWRAGWFLLSHYEPDAALVKQLRMPRPPSSPAQHLSADLTLRYLSTIYRRAFALAPGDQLVTRLGGILRQWPLSGVLANVVEGPATPLDFGGHPGLLLLYAERLAENEKSAWVPHGKALEYVELVYAGLGRRVPQLAANRPEDEVKEDAHV